MRRRLLAAFAALVLLSAGTVVLLAYVRGADARALAGVQTVEVLVADQVIPQGTSADELTALVRTETLPQKAAVDGRVTELAVTEGHQVEQGSVLAVVTPEDEDRSASDTVETAKETP